MSSFSLLKCTMGEVLHSSSACPLCVSCTQKRSHTEQNKICSKFPALPSWSFGETTQGIYMKADARTFVIRICWEDTAACFHSMLPLPGLTPECKSLVHSQGKDTEGGHYVYGERITTASRHDLSFVRMDCFPIHQVFFNKEKNGTLNKGPHRKPEQDCKQLRESGGHGKGWGLC